MHLVSLATNMGMPGDFVLFEKQSYLFYVLHGHALCFYNARERKVLIDLSLSMYNATGKSKRGELSIFPNKFLVLSPCLHMMPRQKAGPTSDHGASKVIYRGKGNITIIRNC